MTRRRRILVALAAVALAAYAALGAAATVRHDQAVRNVFDEMALEGPMAEGGSRSPGSGGPWASHLTSGGKSKAGTSGCPSQR